MMEYCLSIKWKEILIRTTTWINLEKIMNTEKKKRTVTKDYIRFRSSDIPHGEKVETQDL